MPSNAHANTSAKQQPQYTVVEAHAAATGSTLEHSTARAPSTVVDTNTHIQRSPALSAAKPGAGSSPKSPKHTIPGEVRFHTSSD